MSRTRKKQTYNITLSAISQYKQPCARQNLEPYRHKSVSSIRALSFKFRHRFLSYWGFRNEPILKPKYIYVTHFFTLFSNTINKPTWNFFLSLFSDRTVKRTDARTSFTRSLFERIIKLSRNVGTSANRVLGGIGPLEIVDSHPGKIDFGNRSGEYSRKRFEVHLGSSAFQTPIAVRLRLPSVHITLQKNEIRITLKNDYIIVVYYRGSAVSFRSQDLNHSLNYSS